MFGITVLTLVAVSMTIAYRAEKKWADTLGITCIGLIFCIFILALFGKMSWIDYLSVPILAVCIVSLVKDRQLKMAIAYNATIQNACIAITVLILAVSQYHKIAISLEDVGYWITDLKALWSLDGFAGKYNNVAAEYGAYPSAIQMFGWFFSHMSADKFAEGLGYGGYTCLNFILLCPLLSRLDELMIYRDIGALDRKNVGVKLTANDKYYVNDRRLISKYKVKIAGKSVNEDVKPDARAVVLAMGINALACFCLVMFPSMVRTGYPETIEAKITSGIVYGMLLWAIWDKCSESVRFYYARLAAYGMLLVLCEKHGIAWAVSAMLFMFVLNGIRRKRARLDIATSTETDMLKIIGVIGCWIAAYVGWILYCQIQKRLLPDNFMIIHLLEKKSIGLTEISDCIKRLYSIPKVAVIAEVVVLITVAVVFVKKDVVKKYETKFFLIYIALTGMTVMSDMGILYVLGTTILLMGVRISSIDRFDGGRPVTDPSVRKQMQNNSLRLIRIAYIVMAIYILVACDYVGVYNGLIGYRNSREQVTASKKSILDENALNFIDTVTAYKELEGKRVLYLASPNENDMEQAAYISYDISPVAVTVYGRPDKANYETVSQIIDSSHALYFYADASCIGEEQRDELKESIELLCDDGFEWSTLYRIAPNGRLNRFYETSDIQ